MIWNRVYAPFLAIILVLPFFLCSCSKANGKDDSLFVAEGRKTTLGYGEETLYYGMVNGDTLNVCIEVMDFNRFDFVDLSLKELQCATCSSDTSYFTNKISNKYLKSTYKQQMQMLEILLNKHPGSLRQKRIRCIDVPLLTSGALNVEISKAMKGTDIVTAVSKSSLVKELNGILGKYGYAVAGKPYIEKYDSLTNIEKLQDDSITHHRSYKHLIGQYLFYIDEDTNHRGLWVHFTAPL